MSDGKTFLVGRVCSILLTLIGWIDDSELLFVTPFRLGIIFWFGIPTFDNGGWPKFVIDVGGYVVEFTIVEDGGIMGLGSWLYAWILLLLLNVRVFEGYWLLYIVLLLLTPCPTRGD